MSFEADAIVLRDVSKQYLIYQRPEDRLKQFVLPRLHRLMGLRPRRYFSTFSAVSGVSFSVKRGETVGIVGRNGSGKSTLLQMICGTLQPTTGQIEVNGRIAALLELGAGFNPEFSGRENVYLNAAILGLTRSETQERFEKIAEFADIGHFLDLPVKTYSSGMAVRLAFATAINVDPDILVVDEALSVGDEAFQRKCFARIEEIKETGATILFVSHAAHTIVQLCDRAILMDGGEAILFGPPKTVIGQYQRLINLTGEDARDVREEIRELNFSLSDTPSLSPEVQASRERSGDKPKNGTSLETYDPHLSTQSRIEYESQGAHIRDLKILNSEGQEVNVLEGQKRYTYSYIVDFTEDARNVGFGMLVKTPTGLELGGATTSHRRSLLLNRIRSGQSVEVRFEFSCHLLPGIYFLNAGTSASEGSSWSYLHRIVDGVMFRVAPNAESVGTCMVDLSVAPRTIIQDAATGAESPKCSS